MGRQPVGDGVKIRLNAAQVSEEVDKGQEENVTCTECEW